MSLPANWRQLQLFDVVPIRDPNYNTDDVLYSNYTLTAITASRSYMIISVDGCYLKIVSKQFQTLRSFMAYESEYRISFVKAVPNSDLVLSLAERQGYPSVLKLWDLHKLVSLETDSKEDADGMLKTKFQTQVLVQNGDNSYPISCFTFNSDVSCLAIGYTNGKVILVRGDLIRDRGAKQRLIYESPDPVTGLLFNEYHELLYVTTTSKILTVPTTGRNQGKPLKVLSRKIGVPLDCCTIDPEKQELVVGADDSIRYYNHISKSHTINFEINKKIIYRYGKSYLLMVCPEEAATTSTKISSKVVILDLNYKHISFNLTIPNTTINKVFEMWGDLCLLSSDGMLYKLHEKPVNQQVELIIQRESFQLAYSLAKESELPIQTLLKICKLQGEYLYGQGEFEESIKSFMRSLKYYQDSKLVLTDKDESLSDFIMNIITKFKDASNVNHLTEFLYQLYKLRIANNDHVTLLLCCYCKLKMVDRIKSFIGELDLNSSGEASSNDSLLDGRNKTVKTDYSDLDFSLIINLFKECGYYNEVIHLLYKLNQPSSIVDIQLNDLKKPQRSLKYIKSLSIDDLLLILIEHSKILLDYSPIETTELLINVFTGRYTPHEDVKILEEYDNSKGTDEGKTMNQDDDSFPLNSYKSFMAYLSGNIIEDDETTVSSVNNEPTYLPPRPSLIFPGFVNNPNEFVIFLEACIETFDKYQGNIRDKKELLITLYEMYLSLSVKEEENRGEWVGKAEELIENFSELLDESTLLLISHIYGFNCEDVLKKEGYEQDAFRAAQLSKDVEKCFQIVRKYGDKKPELYKLLLRFVVSEEEVFKKVDKKSFDYIIGKLKSLNLASPLEIIQILSTTEFATIGLIRDYLIEIIDISNQEITNNEKLVEYYEKESIKNSYKITEIKTKPFIIQNNKCSACNLKLDFPVIHFKCKHSFHQRCLNDNFLSSSDTLSASPTCSVCINDIDSLQTLRDDQLRSKDEVDMFSSTLQESNDKFKVISNYLGKGVMETDHIQLTDD